MVPTRCMSSHSNSGSEGKFCTDLNSKLNALAIAGCGFIAGFIPKIIGDYMMMGPESNMMRLLTKKLIPLLV